MSHIAIAGRAVGENAPAFVLAEIASAHQGEAVQALALARLARAAGADGVKFQLFRASELIAPNDPRISTFQQIELLARGLGRGADREPFARARPLRRALRSREPGPSPSGTISRPTRSTRPTSRTRSSSARWRRREEPLLLATGGSGLGAVEVGDRSGAHRGEQPVHAPPRGPELPDPYRGFAPPLHRHSEEHLRASGRVSRSRRRRLRRWR